MGENTKIRLNELIEEPPTGLETIRDLYNWSTNYDYRTGTPWLGFLDLIGYSDEEYGQKMNHDKWEVDYASADMLGHALIQWAHAPEHVINYVSALEQAERGDE